MFITFTYWIIQRDSRKSFLNIRIKKTSSNFFNHTMTPNWHLKSFSHQLKYIFKALESVLSFFFSLDIHLRGLCGFFFVWNRGHHALQETIFCCLEGKSFLSNHCRWTHLFMPAGNMTTDVVLNWHFNLMVWFLGPSVVSHWRVVLGTPYLPEGRTAEHPEPTLHCCCHLIPPAYARTLLSQASTKNKARIYQFEALQNFAELTGVG